MKFHEVHCFNYFNSLNYKGYLAAPKLFPFFINELAVKMNNDDRIKGKQSMSNEISTQFLMFAENVASIAKKVKDL
jgi:hypothetical protein